MTSARVPIVTQNGFTLVEAIAVLVVVSIAAVGILAAFSSNGRAIVLADEAHVAQTLVQECAGYITRSKLDSQLSYAAISTTTCDPLPDVAGFTLTVTPVDVTSATVAACPTGAACKDTTIVVTKNATNIASTKILLVNY